MPNVLALDIGGANIKVADGVGYARSWPFALWKAPEQLADKLGECLAAAPTTSEVVITMTGELCDCFETKREGVRAIVAATRGAAKATPVRFYQTTGQFVSADEATENYLLTAASNWHALATFAARYCEGRPGMLIDIGSTTTDIIPIENGCEAARGRTDPERLSSGELTYLGVERTPICAIVSQLRWLDSATLVAKEFFATTGDSYLLLRELPEYPSNTNTADGKPFTRDAAHTRMARIVCGDRELVTMDDVQSFAAQVREGQEKTLIHSLLQVFYGMSGIPQIIVASGQGEFLVRTLLSRVQLKSGVVSLNERLGPEVSRSATAHALATLARERL